MITNSTLYDVLANLSNMLYTSTDLDCVKELALTKSINRKRRPKLKQTSQNV
jgi:hypothetical protein